MEQKNEWIGAGVLVVLIALASISYVITEKTNYCPDKGIVMECERFSVSGNRCYPNLIDSKGYRDCSGGWTKLYGVKVDLSDGNSIIKDKDNQSIMITKEEKVTFNITSSTPYHFISDREWAYEKAGYEIINSIDRIIIKDSDSICKTKPFEYVYDSNGIPISAKYRCINYTPDLRKSLYLITNYSARIDFFAGYDPTPAVITTNMTVFFPLNETTGLIAKNYGSANNLGGTLGATENEFINDTDGIFRMRCKGITAGFPNAFDLNTSESGELDIPTGGDGSLCLTIRPSQIDRGSKLIRFSSPGDDRMEYNTDETVQMYWLDRNVKSISTILENETKHICFTFDNSLNTGKIYINGSLDNTNTNMDQDFAMNPSNFFIGHRDYSDSFNGTIGSVRYWSNLALNSSQVLTVYNTDLNISEEPPPAVTAPSILAVSNYSFSNSSIGWNITCNKACNMSGTRGIYPSYTDQGTFRNESFGTELRNFTGGLKNDTLYAWNITNACEPAGNCNTSGFNFTLKTSVYILPSDTILPNATIKVNNTSPRYNDTVNISSTALDETALSQCWFLNNQSNINSTPIDLTGTEDTCFNLTLITLKRSAVINFTVYINDSSGNLNSNSTIITIANTPPTFNETLAPQTVTPPGSLSMQINCTDLDGDTITYFDNSTLFNIDSGTGLISDTPTESETGVYNISITCGDTFANISQTFLYTILDGTPPNVTITINNTSPRFNDTINISSISTDGFQLSQCWYFNNQTNTNSTPIDLTGTQDTCFNLTVITLTRGEVINFTVYVNDTSGNLGTNSTEITIANTAPTFNQTLANQEVTTPNSLNMQINCSDIDQDTITFFDNSTLFNINPNTGLIQDTPIQTEAGVYNITITCGDTFENTTETFLYTINDGTPPNATIAVNNTSPKVNKSINISSNVTDGKELSQCWFFNNQSNINSTPVDLSGTSSSCFNITLITLTRGNVINFTVYVNDTSGNLKSNSTTITIANTAPTFNDTIADQFVTTPTGTLILDINCTDLDGDTITYYDNSTLFNINPSTGEITDTPTASEAGTHNITLTCGDTFDNTTQEFDYIIIDGTSPQFTFEPSNYSTDNQSTRVNWTNDEQTNYSVTWGECPTHDTMTTNNNSFSGTHDINISGLNNDTLYCVNVTVWDTLSNRNDTNFSFKTLNYTIIDVTPPIVTLESPEDGAFNDTSDPVNITFNCSVTDESALKNLSFYITNSTNQSFSFNRSVDITGIANSSLFILNLSVGNYTWNCLAFDTGNNSAYASANRTIKINFTSDLDAPNITNLRNTSISNQTATVEWDCNENCNYTTFLFNDSNRTVLVNATNSSAFSASGTINYYNLLNFTTYYFNLTVCDVSGNCNTNNTFNFTTSQTVVVVPPLVGCLDFYFRNRSNHADLFKVECTGIVNVTNDIGIASRLTFELGEMLENVIDGWIKLTGSLQIDGDLIINGDSLIRGNSNITGNFTVNDSVLFVNRDSGNVGIGTTAPTQELNVVGDLNVTHNFTGNQIYGEMYNYSSFGDSFTVDIVTAGVYVNISGFSVGDLNGFTFTKDINNGDYLTAMIAGKYFVVFGMSWEAVVAGGTYGFSIAKNFDHTLNRKCYRRRDGTGSLGALSINCFYDLAVGDTLNLKVEDENSPVKDIMIDTMTLTVMRVGD